MFEDWHLALDAATQNRIGANSFIFDPASNALLLLGGDKQNDWSGWSKTNYLARLVARRS